MKAIVAYESIYGNTRQIAEAIAAGLESLGEVEVVSVNHGDAGAADGGDVVILGGPTHMHGLATSMSRKQAAQAAEEEEDVSVEPGAADGPGLRKWLSQRSGDGRPAAAFDTRLDRSPVLTGAAARGVAKRLRRRGYEVIADPESFFVEDAEGPLAGGELDRARAPATNRSSSWSARGADGPSSGLLQVAHSSSEGALLSRIVKSTGIRSPVRADGAMRDHRW